MLRRKVFSHILVIECITLLLFLAAFGAIYQNYEKIEEKTLQLNIDRVISALNREIDNLNQLTFEWASTGVIYSVSQSDSSAYFRNILFDIVVGGFGVDKMLVFNKDGSLLLAKEQVTQSDVKIEREILDSNPFLDALLNQPELINLTEHDIHSSGLVLLAGNLHIVSSQPILQTKDATSHSGTMVLTTTFDLAALSNLSDLVHQDVRIIPLGKFDRSIESGVLMKTMSADSNKTVFVRESGKQIDTYTLLPNFVGNNRFILKLTSQRRFIQQATETMVYTAVGLFLLFALLVIYILFFLDRSILQRLQSISITVSNFAFDQHGQRLPVCGNDEISAFASAFNLALESLEKTQLTLKDERDQAQTTLASIGEAVITTGLDGHIHYMNTVAEKITGHNAKDSVGKSLELIFKPMDEDGNTSENNLANICILANEDIIENDFCCLIDLHGTETIIESMACPIRNHNNQITGAVLVIRDVSQAKSLQKNLIYQASHDGLTDLYNRTEFERQLTIISKAAARSDQNHHLIFIDLDRFKIVNDSCGHIAGDKVLREIAQLMKAEIRRNDILARIGGDEFGVILTDCKFQHAYEIAESLREVISSFRFHFQDKVFNFGASMGLVNLKDQPIFSDCGVLSVADAACRAAKNSGRNRVHVFKPKDQDLAQHQQRTQWVTRVTDALDNEHFILYYQKIADVSGKKDALPYAEILLRMLGPDGELIPPGAFLPAAERYGLMKFVDKWIIEHFCEWMIEHPYVVDEIETFAINLSGQSMNDNEFLGYLSDYLSRDEILTRRICFEITETAAIHNLSNCSRFINTLKEKGCKFLLDDFGSGMSSFSYLKHLPVDVLKIDGQFVKNVEHQPIDLAMVKSITEIGHLMNIKSVAEYVTNENSLSLVTEIGVDYVQGYFIHEPECLANLEATQRKISGF